MKLPSVILSLLVTTLYCNAQWTAKAPIPGGNRLAPFSFVIQDTVYIGGGEQTNMWAYNTAGNTWKQKANVPGVVKDRTFAISFTLNGRAFVGGGADGSYHAGNIEKQDLWEYHAGTDSWTQKADLPSLFQLGTFVLNNKAYLLTADNAQPGLYEYDEANDKWWPKQGHPGTQLFNAYVFNVGNKGYVSCGNDGTGGVKYTYEYDPLSNTWKTMAAFPGDAREAGMAFTLGNKAYIGFGANYLFNTYYNDMYVFDPAANSWINIGQFPGDERAYATAAVVNNKAYVGSGWTSDASSTYYTDWFGYVPLTHINSSAVVSVRCYPNPSSGIVNISGNDGKGWYTITDMYGRVVQNGVADQNFQINLSEQCAGQYLLTINTDIQKLHYIITKSK